MGAAATALLLCFPGLLAAVYLLGVLPGRLSSAAGPGPSAARDRPAGHVQPPSVPGGRLRAHAGPPRPFVSSLASALLRRTGPDMTPARAGPGREHPCIVSAEPEEEVS